MAASGVGAAIALAAIADELPGEIVFLGTPAEERGSGKQIMIDDGLFDGIDAALLYHPCDRSHVESHPLASEDVDVVFTGLQAHASSDPWKGKNALDALISLFISVGLWRQQLRPTARVHGIIREGGTAANIIPDRTVGLVHDPQRRRGRLRADARALPARCARRPPWRPTRPSRSPSPAAPRRCATTRVLAERFRANMAAYGIADQGDDPNAGSTDMANVSWVCPTIHPDLAIAPEGTPGHSILFRDAAATPQADETTLLAATLVAQTAVRALRRPGPGRRPPGPSSARADRGRRRTGSAARRGRRCGATIRGAPRWTMASNRRRPSETATAAPPRRVRLRRTPWPSAPTTPSVTSRPRTAGIAAFETYDDFDLPTYVGPVIVHEAAVGHRSGRAPPPRGRTSRSSARRSTTR